MNKTCISKVLPTDVLNGEGVKKIGQCILMVLCRPEVKMVKIKVSCETRKLIKLLMKVSFYMMHWNPQKGSNVWQVMWFIEATLIASFDIHLQSLWIWM